MITYNGKKYPVNIIKNPVGVTVQVEYANGDHREFYFKDGKYDEKKTVELLSAQLTREQEEKEQMLITPKICPTCGQEVK